MAQVATDTPDNQRGTVNAQKQLAFLNKTSDVEIVGLPPNVETLVIATPTNSLLSTPVCLGLTTALNYPAVRIGGFLGSLGATHWMFDVSSALDAQVQITWPGAHLEQWWIYADSGVRLVVNPTQASNQGGVQYVIPTVPNITTGDHPPNELQYASGNVAANTTVVNPPGAGMRFRAFSAWLTANTTGNGTMGSTAGGTLIACPPGGHGNTTFGPSGLPLPANAGIQVFTSGGGVAIYYGVTYTTETI